MSSFIQIIKDEKHTEFPLHAVVVWTFIASQFFFATGHLHTFNGLHWGAAFVGIEEMNMFIGGTLVILETFASHIIVTLSLPILVSWIYYSPKEQNNFTFKILAKKYLAPLLVFNLVFALNATLTTIFVYRERRALMVWRVFAPKLCFEGLFLIVVDVLQLLTLFILLRCSSRKHK
jgi:phosphatidylinositol glycan class O